MQRLVAALALVIACAGCGGTDWNSAHVTSDPGAQGSGAAAPAKGAGPPAAKSKVAVAAAAAAAAEKPYVDAMVVSATADAAGHAELKAVDLRCVASALVHGFGVQTFSANGITPNALRRPDSSLDALPDPSDAQISAVGAALQRCSIGTVLAKSFATGLHITDPGAVTCFSGRVDTDPGLRRFVVMTWLARKIDLETAHDLVGLMAACIDLPTFILQSANIQADADTRACLATALNNSDAELKDYLALRISGADPDTEQQRYEAILVAMNHCRPSARTGFTVPSG